LVVSFIKYAEMFLIFQVFTCFRQRKRLMILIKIIVKFIIFLLEIDEGFVRCYLIEDD